MLWPLFVRGRVVVVVICVHIPSRVRVGHVIEDARDAKTALQEWAQARGLPPPAYVQTDRQGPDHAPVFTITARIENGASAVASASSKRQAEQAAAKTLLAQLERPS